MTLAPDQIRTKTRVDRDSNGLPVNIQGPSMAKVSLPERPPGLEAVCVDGQWFMLVAEPLQTQLESYWDSLAE